jgi:hypothetical protein
MGAELNSFQIAAKQLVEQMVDNQYVHVDQVVKLTGKFAVNPSVGLGTPGTRRRIESQTLVEVVGLDPDVKLTKWVKVDDLYVIATVTKGNNG